jgi:hypothetical protein
MAKNTAYLPNNPMIRPLPKGKKVELINNKRRLKGVETMKGY